PARRDARAHQHRRRAPHLDREGRGRDPRARRRTHCRARHASRAPRAEWALRGDVPPAAARGGARSRRGAVRTRKTRADHDHRRRQRFLTPPRPVDGRHGWPAVMGARGGGGGGGHGGGAGGFFQEDEILGKAYDATLTRRLVGYLGPYRSLVAVAIVLLLLQSLAQIVPPVLAKEIVDQAVIPAVTGTLPRDEAFTRLALLGLVYLAVL